MSQYNRIANIYNPLNQSYEELLKNFVIRKKEFNKIIRELKNSDLTTSAQHFLIEGQRGTGKSSLLLRVRYEIEHEKEFSNLIPIQFAEEQYNIFDLCRIWESAAELLEEYEGFEGLGDELEKMSYEADYAIDCFNILENYLVKNEKRLVLLLDNFGDILDKLSETEQQRLRDIFHTSKHIQLVASSSRALEATYKHDKPFYEFFKIIKLDGLDKEDTYTLLEQLAKTVKKDIQTILQDQPERVEIIRRLTGGIPRTIVLLFEIFLDESANVFEDLEMILDRVTPLYKHRMDDLATQQQAIMDTIALNWDGITAKEISENLKNRGFDTKKVSSQLNLLEKNNLVISTKIDKKNKLYMVKERFFNIWYLMRYGRKKNQAQVLWLVKFLQEWCDRDELINRAKNHIRCAKENVLHPKGGLYMAEALASIIPDMKIQHELLIETKKALMKFNPSIDKNLPQSDLEIFRTTINYEKIGKLKHAIKNYIVLVEKGHIEAMILLGILYYSELEDYVNAIKYFEMAVEKGDFRTMIILGNLYQDELKDYDNAIKYYKMAVEKGEVDGMLNLGVLYQKKLKDYDNAIKYYKMAVEKENSDAMVSLGILYQKELKDYDNAFKYYKMAVEKDDSDAILNLGVLYQKEFKDYDNAIKYYKMAVEKDDSRAMVNLGILYQHGLKDYDNAIKYYKMAIEKDDSRAMVNLGNLYQKDKDYDNAIKYYKMAVEKDDSDAMVGLGILYQNELKEYDNAIKYYKMAVEKDDPNAMVNLGILYQNELKDYDNAIKYYKIAVEKDNLGAMNSLSWIYYELIMNKKESLALAKQSVDIEKTSYNIHTLAVINLWHDLYEESILNIEEFINSFEYEKFVDDMIEYFLLLLAKKQYHSAYKLFEKYKDLKDQLKPIYYTLMRLLKDEYPKEYLKMGSELEETVDEILEAIEEKAKKYK